MSITNQQLATRLSYASLTPLLFIPLFIAYTNLTGTPVEHPKEMLLIFQAYLAIILSFTGGINWLAAIRFESTHTKSILLWSIISPMTAWISMLFEMKYASLAVYAVLFFFQFYLDRKITGELCFENWFIKLRKITTMLVIFSIIIMTFIG